jgi:hypothetical protein
VADADSAAPIVVINETVARTWWPDGSALGDRLIIGRYEEVELLKGVARQVIGVVGDTKAMTLQAAVRPTVYVPLATAFGSSSIAYEQDAFQPGHRDGRLSDASRRRRRRQSVPSAGRTSARRQ